MTTPEQPTPMKRTHQLLLFIGYLFIGYLLIAVLIWAYKIQRPPLPPTPPSNPDHYTFEVEMFHYKQDYADYEDAKGEAQEKARVEALLWPIHFLLEAALHITKPTPPSP